MSDLLQVDLSYKPLKVSEVSFKAWGPKLQVNVLLSAQTVDHYIMKIV